MSAELYDAEIAGALARPAVDVLPSQPARKGKDSARDDVAEQAPVAAPIPEPVDAADAVAGEAAAGTVPDAAPEPLQAVEDATGPAPRKVFGMTLGRRAKATPVAEIAEVAEITDLPEQHAELLPIDDVERAEIPAPPVAEAASDEQPAVPEPELAPAPPAIQDHTDEVRAMRALLEASEQVRQVAEQRTLAAEAELRTVTNSVQEWQIRHREAEATITELAASLAGAENRMAELAGQVRELQAERDELVGQLDAATSPATS